jgi:hypothetical protein
MRGLLLLSALLVSGCASLPAEVKTSTAGTAVSAFSDHEPDSGLPHGWLPLKVGILKKPTQYRLTEDGGETVLKAVADASASGLYHPVNVDPREHPLLRWRWKTRDLIEGADNTQRHAEDSPVRLLVAFDGDISRLPLGDRMVFDQFKAFAKQDLPYATLMYIWENRQPVGSVIANQHTSRIRMVVVESGPQAVGEWREMTRNVREDFIRAFGEEPGKIHYVGVMSDTDNTGGRAEAWYGDIEFDTALKKAGE